MKAQGFFSILYAVSVCLSCQKGDWSNLCDPDSPARAQIIVLSALTSSNQSPCLLESGLGRLSPADFSKKDITSFSIPSLNITGIISENRIQLTADNLTSLTPLVAKFTTTGKSVTVNGVEQISEVTINSFDTNLTYVVTALDNSTKSYVVTLTAPRTYGSSSLRVWLRADSLALNDGDAVQTWNDVSGFGNNATQSVVSQRPILKKNQIGTLSTVQFRSGNTQRLDFSGATGLYITNSGSFFVVMKLIGTNALGTTILNLHRAQGREFSLVHLTGQFLVCRNGLACAQSSGFALPFNSYVAIGSFQNANTTVTELWNGDFKGSISAVGADFDYSGGGTPGEGYLNNGNLDADIAEVLFFNTLITQNEQDKIFCYLRAKYNLTATTTSCGN